MFPGTLLLGHERSMSIMSTNCYGQITLSTRKHATTHGDFSGAKELKDAWNALARGKALTWKQEYAVESLWHEIMHNRQVIKVWVGDSDPRNRLLEAVNQWVSRRTYQDFLAKFGATPTHQADIIRNGLGYRHWLKNFDSLLARLNVRDTDILAAVRDMHATKGWETYNVHLTALLAKKNPAVSAGKIQRALRTIDMSEKDFSEFLDAFVQD